MSRNVYAFTAWRILVDPDGNGVGWVEFWGAIRPDAPDHFIGDAAFYALNFDALPTPPMSVPTEGWRVAVEGQ